ncbi:tetratricopeptide repeat protein [Candidatus Frankia alpina]|uniref:Tetratricopeptide repeat protein n=1 Tax=Candidatus Frankia alpina TaxID=2699483 RepID=A0A4S5EGI3_9ACTN|nr:tetratricopeptide repeat protein [Candidatus Frankia alpina]
MSSAPCFPATSTATPNTGHPGGPCCPIYAPSWTANPATRREVSWLCDRTGAYLTLHGRPDTALPYHHRALTLNTHDLGPDHPHTLTSRNNLAAARAARDHDQAAQPDDTGTDARPA